MSSSESSHSANSGSSQRLDGAHPTAPARAGSCDWCSVCSSCSNVTSLAAGYTALKGRQRWRIMIFIDWEMFGKNIIITGLSTLRSDPIQSESTLDLSTSNSDYWTGKDESDCCPRCTEVMSTAKTTRVAHYKRVSTYKTSGLDLLPTVWEGSL